jgi:transcriptional regulator with XRE-family HTH domain
MPSTKQSHVIPPTTAVLVGQRIRRLRESRGLSQGQFAESVGRTQAAVSQWESGRRTPSVEDLIEIAGALGENLSKLLPDASPTSPVPALLRAQVGLLEHRSLNVAIETFLRDASILQPIAPMVTLSEDNPIRAAQLLLSRAGVVTLPVPVEDLAALCGAHVLRCSFDDALSGLVVELDVGPVIAVNADHVPVRQRFTIAHELGHLILGHGPQFYIDLQSRPEDGDPPGYHARHEREANDFAANTLMPAAMVRASFGRRKTVEPLARTFGVSDLAMRYRLANLGLR